MRSLGLKKLGVYEGFVKGFWHLPGNWKLHEVVDGLPLHGGRLPVNIEVTDETVKFTGQVPGELDPVRVL